MPEKNEKMYGKGRREWILAWLKESSDPLNGTVLAEKTSVSRQVIVQDISLLKAGGEPIMATSRGYLYLKENSEKKVQRVIAVNHQPKDTANELYTLVDRGVTVLNAMVEHPIYGDLSGSLMLQNRRDVDAFLNELHQTQASLLLNLTGGLHLHMIEAATVEQLDEACEVLSKAGYLLENEG